MRDDASVSQSMTCRLRSCGTLELFISCGGFPKRGSMKNENGVSEQGVSYLDELHIRARSPKHQEQYNQLFSAAKEAGMTPDEARVYAVRSMRAQMGFSGQRTAYR